jgi:hypothetical protein
MSDRGRKGRLRFLRQTFRLALRALDVATAALVFQIPHRTSKGRAWLSYLINLGMLEVSSSFPLGLTQQYTSVQ